MAKPIANSGIILSTGNAAAPFYGTPPVITERIGRGGSTMRAPGLTGNAPRITVLERLTPPNVNAAKGIQSARARITRNIARTSATAVETAKRYGKSLTARQRAPLPNIVPLPRV